ncbi:MAG: hypothetical protein IT562_13405 [Alphaproteobacteria bacterium]|nr:hypothetical protein [Alphaproteobacteria bacterium]
MADRAMSNHHDQDVLHGRARPGHGHGRLRWSAMASDVGGRLVRILPAVAVLWLAVAWALAAGTE